VRTSDAFDRLGRPLRSLRLSVTDRCNLRCAYCMPEADYVWLPRAEILDFDEIAALTEIFARLGVTRLRLTGGEPLLRKDLAALVAKLARVPGIEDLAMTTNGVTLAPVAIALRQAGLRRITISLDTLRPERFAKLTSRDLHARVLEGIAAACAAGFRSVKLNTVVMRGTNDDEIGDLLAFAARCGAELRFIEYMDVGGATGWERTKVVSRREILAIAARAGGGVRALPARGSAPAERFVLGDGTEFGVIASTTAPFCRECDRSRLTADGHWYLCLYARSGLDLRALLRGGAPREAIEAAIVQAWRARADRGAEERLAVAGRGPLASADELRHDPRLEMHTRGG
jgi:cyclic pyranopterin phosphate synthase